MDAEFPFVFLVIFLCKEPFKPCFRCREVNCTDGRAISAAGNLKMKRIGGNGMAKPSGSNADSITVKLPKGTKERMKKLLGKGGNEYMVDLILSDLDRLEKRQKKGPDIFIP